MWRSFDGKSKNGKKNAPNKRIATSNPREPPIMQCQLGANFLSMVFSKRCQRKSQRRHCDSMQKLQRCVHGWRVLKYDNNKCRICATQSLTSLITLAATSNFPGYFSQAATTTCSSVRQDAAVGKREEKRRLLAALQRMRSETHAAIDAE